MSFFSKTLAIVLASSTIGLAVASTSTPAEARGGHHMGGGGHFGGGHLGGGHFHPSHGFDHGLGHFNHFGGGYGYGHYRFHRWGFYGSRNRYYGGTVGGSSAPVGVRTCPAGTHFGSEGKFCWPNRVQVSQAPTVKAESVPQGAVLPTTTEK